VEIESMMRSLPSLARWLGVAAALGACPHAAQSEPVTVSCEHHLFGGPTGEIGQSSGAYTPMTLTYTGEATGKLEVKAVFGEMSLAANKKTAEEDNGDGKKSTVTGITASGTATVTMPDKAAIESCVASKLTPEEAKDEDLSFMRLLSCMTSAPPTAAKVPVTVAVRVILYPGDDGSSVEIDRTYPDPAKVPGGTIKVASDSRNCHSGAK
jgi:hypothetical protein